MSFAESLADDATPLSLSDQMERFFSNAGEIYGEDPNEDLPFDLSIFDGKAKEIALLETIEQLTRRVDEPPISESTDLRRDTLERGRKLEGSITPARYLIGAVMAAVELKISGGFESDEEDRKAHDVLVQGRAIVDLLDKLSARLIILLSH